MNIIKNIKYNYEELNKSYELITAEMQKNGYAVLGNLFFFPLYLYGFVFSMNIFSESFDTSTPFNILFNWSLVGYATVIAMAATFLSCRFRNAFFKGFFTRSLELLMSLLFICLAGYTIREVDIPFLTQGSVIQLICLTEVLVFSYLWLVTKILVDEIDKKKEALATIKWVIILFSIILLVVVIFS